MKLFFSVLMGFFIGPAFSQNGGIVGCVISEDPTSDFNGLETQLQRVDVSTRCASVDHCGNFSMYNVEPGQYTVQLYNNGKIVFYDLIRIRIGEITQLNLTHPKLNGKSRKICPHGHIGQFIPIASGMPSEELIHESKMGKVMLGGCIITDSKWYCKKHKVEF